MKKTTFVAGAALLAFGAASAFAQTSNTNKSTAGLINDTLIDNLDVGVEDSDGIIFGGYNMDSSQVEIGVGHTIPTGGGYTFPSMTPTI